jgi:O-antigen ligase
MHPTQTYSLAHPLTMAAQPNSGLLAYLRGFTLTFWLFTMLFRLWWVSDWFALQELFESGFDIKGYFYYGFAAAVLGHLTLGPQAWITAPFALLSDWTGRLITIFFLLMLCLSPLSVVPWGSLKYSVATWLVIVLLMLFWASNYRVLQRVLVITGMVLFAWLFILVLKHGLTGGFAGQIGGINRNVTSTAALAAMIFMLFSSKPIFRWAAFAGAAFLVVSVTSRGSILAMGVFVGVYYALHVGTMKAAVHALLAFLFFAAAVVAFPYLQHLVFEDVFRLSSRSRGFRGGFSGRYEMWNEALGYFWKRPILGYGFRSSSIGAGFGGVHSAYLKILLEAGFVGTFFLLGAAITELIRRLRLSLRLKSLEPNGLPGINIGESLQINAICCATLCALLTLWIYDQYYINLGSPISIVFFLVIVAPTFITAQGVTLRKPELAARRIAAGARA